MLHLLFPVSVNVVQIYDSVSVMIKVTEQYMKTQIKKIEYVNKTVV